MNKCVCDICRKNEANHKFKVKRHMLTDYITGKWGYRNIDICESCFNKLLRIPLDKKIEDDIFEALSRSNFEERYSNPELQAAYLDGCRVALEKLVHRKILKM